MTEEDRMAVPGVAEYEMALGFENEGSFDEAEVALKEALKKVKQEGQSMDKTYLFLMKKLATVCF